ncbi:MAG: AAA family ATPase [Oligoflexia bacterium]|nr:AAA family ATPase [Oligoflexia bacterium]
MKLVIVDSAAENRAALQGRIAEALRQADLKNTQIIELDPARIETFEWHQVSGCLVGPGCFEHLEECVQRVRLMNPNGALGAVLLAEDYSGSAVILRKKLPIQVIPLDDVVQLAGFLIDAESRSTAVETESRNRGVIGIAQLKGGVGCTTLTAALASCWARHGLSVAALDFDDVNPQLTAWARVGVVQRTVTSEFLRTGEVPAQRVNEMLHPVEGFEGRFVVVGQPEAYNESFHYKANVLDGAPSASEFVNSLIATLSNEFDAVIIDLARSWGVATFTALPLCSQLVLVTDDDGMSVRRTLDAFQRLRKESDDPEEFNLDKWSVVLNGFTGKLITPKEVATEIQEMDLLSAQSSLFTVPFSESGRQWGAPGQSMFETADPRTREVLRRMACNLIPFSFEPEEALGSKLIKKVQSLVHF